MKQQTRSVKQTTLRTFWEGRGGGVEGKRRENSQTQRLKLMDPGGEIYRAGCETYRPEPRGLEDRVLRARGGLGWDSKGGTRVRMRWGQGRQCSKCPHPSVKPWDTRTGYWEVGGQRKD